MIHIYGIKNCDTVKKAIKWLDENGVAYEFHDYKTEGADYELVEKAINAHGWEKVINKRGMSWRKLDDQIKANMDENGAKVAAFNHPILIKRPLVVANDDILLGFDADIFSSKLKA